MVPHRKKLVTDHNLWGSPDTPLSHTVHKLSGPRGCIHWCTTRATYPKEIGPRKAKLLPRLNDVERIGHQSTKSTARTSGNRVFPE